MLLQLLSISVLKYRRRLSSSLVCLRLFSCVYLYILHRRSLKSLFNQISNCSSTWCSLHINMALICSCQEGIIWPKFRVLLSSPHVNCSRAYLIKEDLRNHIIGVISKVTLVNWLYTPARMSERSDFLACLHLDRRVFQCNFEYQPLDDLYFRTIHP